MMCSPYIRALTYRKDGYSYSVTTKNGRSIYAVSDGTKTVSIPIVWAMGAQAQTWVLERNGNLYESRVSYYPSIHGSKSRPAMNTSLRRTSKRPSVAPSAWTKQKHASTATVPMPSRSPARSEGSTSRLGVRALPLGSAGPRSRDALPEALPRRFRHRSANCSQRTSLISAGNVTVAGKRLFAPIGAARPTCASSPTGWPTADALMAPIPASVASPVTIPTRTSCGISLTTTRNAWPATIRPQQHAEESTHPKTCPVAKSRCASCHMPQESLPNGLLRFTDHQIRIVKPNETYPN